MERRDVGVCVEQVKRRGYGAGELDGKNVDANNRTWNKIKKGVCYDRVKTAR